MPWINVYNAVCRKCGWSGPKASSRNKAVEKWDYRPAPEPGAPADMDKTGFEKELERLLNKHSMESGSDTPDFILSKYLLGCLEVYNSTVKAREKWYGRVPVASDVQLPPPSGVGGEIP